MKGANRSRGRIEEHAKGLGTLTEEMVEKRARELAVANGRRADQLNRSDLDEARAELEAIEPPASVDGPGGEGPAALDGSPPVAPPRSAAVQEAADEQEVSSDLAEEGLEEADHEQRVAGNEESRRRGRAYHPPFGAGEE